MAFITIAGENKFAQKQAANQPINITHFVLANIAGLGAEPANRIEALPDTGDIVATRAVTQSGYVNANVVVYSLVMDSTVGDFDFNWLGLITNENVLVSVSHLQEVIEKRKTDGATQGNNITRNFAVRFQGMQALDGIDVPAETWQIDFTQRLLEIDERERLSNLDRFGLAAFYGDSFKVSHVSGSTYALAAGVAYVAGIRCESAAAINVTATPLPKAIWLDVSLQGDISGVEAVFVATASSAALVDFTDGLGFKHYLFKVAAIAGDGAITDLRPPALMPQAFVKNSNVSEQILDYSVFGQALVDGELFEFPVQTVELQNIPAGAKTALVRILLNINNGDNLSNTLAIRKNASEAWTIKSTVDPIGYLNATTAVEGENYVVIPVIFDTATGSFQVRIQHNPAGFAFGRAILPIDLAVSIWQEGFWVDIERWW